jgi:pimeloyl-ACP methyl ester carboxylesterase
MVRTTAAPGRDTTLTLSDGRTLAYAEWGDSDGSPVVLLHGMPGSRLICPDEEATAAAGVRLLTLDRPGYGGSDPRPGLTLVGWVDDFAQWSAALELTACPLLGWSGGAAYALAVAFHRPELTNHLGLLAGAGPVDEVPGAWPGLAPEDRELLEAARREGDGARAALLDDARSFTDDPDGLLDEAGDDHVDFAGRPDVRAALLTMFREAARQGPAGIADDEFAQLVSPWGFDLAGVGCPVEVWWGEQDDRVSRQHAEFLATRLPDANLHVVAGAGHAIPTSHWAEILASVGAGAAAR